MSEQPSVHPPLSPAERAVALTLYRRGGGQQDAAAFQSALDTDPLAQAIARAVTPVLGEFARAVSALFSPPASGPSEASP